MYRGVTNFIKRIPFFMVIGYIQLNAKRTLKNLKRKYTHAVYSRTYCMHIIDTDTVGVTNK